VIFENKDYIKCRPSCCRWRRSATSSSGLRRSWPRRRTCCAGSRRWGGSCSPGFRRSRRTCCRRSSV